MQCVRLKRRGFEKGYGYEVKQRWIQINREVCSQFFLKEKGKEYGKAYECKIVEK